MRVEKEADADAISIHRNMDPFRPAVAWRFLDSDPVGCFDIGDS